MSKFVFAAVTCLAFSAPAYSQVPLAQKGTVIVIDLSKADKETVAALTRHVQKNAEDIDQLEDMGILQHLKSRSLNGTLVEQGVENQEQWQAVGGLTAAQAVQSAATVTQSAKVDKAETTNTQQDQTIAVQGAQIEQVEAKNVQQDQAIVDVTKTITRTVNKSAKVDAAQNAHLEVLDGEVHHLQDENRDQWTAINAHDALLSEHSAQINKLGKGVASAMAMPDLYLGDLENFAVAGSMGYWDGETAIAFGMVGRMDRNWSVNLSVAAPTDFSSIGGRLGVRRAW